MFCLIEGLRVLDEGRRPKCFSPVELVMKVLASNGSIFHTDLIVSKSPSAVELERMFAVHVASEIEKYK